MPGDGCWLDVTTFASMYEIAFNPQTMKYRHRIRRLIPTEDSAIILVRTIDAAEWFDGPPPPYPS